MAIMIIDQVVAATNLFSSFFKLFCEHGVKDHVELFKNLKFL